MTVPKRREPAYWKSTREIAERHERLATTPALRRSWATAARYAHRRYLLALITPRFLR